MGGERKVDGNARDGSSPCGRGREDWPTIRRQAIAPAALKMRRKGSPQHGRSRAGRIWGRLRRERGWRLGGGRGCMRCVLVASLRRSRCRLPGNVRETYIHRSARVGVGVAFGMVSLQWASPIVILPASLTALARATKQTWTELSDVIHGTWRPLRLRPQRACPAAMAKHSTAVSAGTKRSLATSIVSCLLLAPGAAAAAPRFDPPVPLIDFASFHIAAASRRRTWLAPPRVLISSLHLARMWLWLWVRLPTRLPACRRRTLPSSLRPPFAWLVKLAS